MLEQVTVIAPGVRFDDSRRGRIAAEFPSIFIAFDDAPGDPPHLASSEWDRPDFDTWAFDCEVDRLACESFTLRIAGDRPEFPLEVLNRCQRAIDRRNRHSQGQSFDRVLRRHRKLHDLAKPLVRADHNHALDVWQWVLRLEPDASLALQLAALFHDVERLVSEPDARIEHLAANYQAFKDAHARAGAEITRAVLAESGMSECVRERVAAIVAAHERPGDDPDVATLNDADALSFFCLNANGYADYFGPEQTAKKVAYTWNRLRPAARARLATVRLRDDLRALLPEVA